LGRSKRKRENSELVSRANQLKLTAADGKKYLTDLFDYDGRSNDRRVFIKGIDYSCYYEQEDNFVESAGQLVLDTDLWDR